MTLLIDANALFAQADADDPLHPAVSATLRDSTDELVTSELVVAEADYLILDRLGIDAEFKFIADLVERTFIVDCLSRGGLEKARELIDRYRDLRLGLADASLVVLAERHATTRIVTLDERAFRTVRPLQGGVFTILPADHAI